MNLGVLLVFLVYEFIFAGTAHGTTFSPPDLEWEKTSQSLNISSNSVYQTEGGGYVVAGHSIGSFGHTFGGLRWLDSDCNLIQREMFSGKVDPPGVYMDYESNYLFSAIQVADGGYVAVGSALQPRGAGAGTDTDAWALRLDAQYNIVPGGENYTGNRLYGVASVNETFNSIIQAKNGGYVAVGQSGTQGWILWLDAMGNQIAAKFYGTEFHCVQRTADNGYVMAGEQNGYLLVVKLDEHGNENWAYVFPQPGTGRSIIQTTDGGYVIMVEYINNPRFEICKLNSSGQLQWGTGNDNISIANSMGSLSSFAKLPDGGFVVIINNSSSTQYGSVYIARFDIDGKQQWQKILGGRESEAAEHGSLPSLEAHSIRQTPDGGFIVAGEHYDRSNKECKLWVAKLSPEKEGGGGADNGNYPIIFVPGIMGSDLYDSHGSPVWPMTTAFANADLGNPNLYVRNARNLQDSATDKYYGTMDYSKVMLTKICNDFQNRSVYFFSYDWRYSSDKNATALNNFIKQDLGGSKVDIIAHSMGGLVASSLFKSNPGVVNKVITIATPYEGAPEVFTRATSKTKLTGTLFDHFLTNLDGITPDIKRSFESLAELAPTMQYVSKQPMYKYVGIGVPYELTNDEYVSRCTKLFNEKYSSAASFQNSIRVNGYNALRGLNSAFFTVIGTGKHTVNAVTMSLDPNSTPYTSDIKYDNNGDGTVPYASSTMMGEINSDRLLKATVDHTGIVKNSSVIEFVENALRGTISRSTGRNLADDSALKPYIVVRVACPVDATIAKDGEILTSKESEFNDTASFGRMDLIGLDGEIKMFCLDEDSYPVTLRGTDSGTMDYAIRFFDADNKLLEEKNIEDVPITNKTIITTDIRRDAQVALKIDTDGDGVIDNTVMLEESEAGDANDSNNSNNPSNPTSPTNPSNPTNPTTPKDPVVVWGDIGGTSGGGCDVGSGFLLLALAGLVLKLRKGSR
jgi:pimeloyl-ACP methyl ester carboxylesterase